jgi:hypothetical protein
VLGSTKGLLWSGAPDCPVRHRTVSGAPEDFSSNSSPSGKFQSPRAIIHRTVRCTPDSVRCSFETRLRNSPVSGIREGCSAIIHRTVWCILGATATSRQRSSATAINARQSAQASGTPLLAHRTVNSSCPVRHRTSRWAQKSELQRSDSIGTGDVAGAPDMSGVHRTVRCTIEQTAPPTVMFGGWGYKYPNHPTIHGIQVFHFPTTYKSSSIQS